MTEAAAIERGYVDAGGVHTYYEVEGTGEPLVLMHGGLCAIETYGALRPLLTPHFRVYLPERRGHGRTADVPGPWHHERLADDTIAFIEALKLGPVYLAGWSGGGIVALYVALRRPDLIRRLVVIEAIANHDGDPPQVKQMIQLDHMPDGFLPPALRAMYGAVSPDGADNFDAVVDKSWQMMRREPAIQLADLARIEAPALVVMSDDGMVTAAHGAAMAGAFANGRVVTVPDSNHALPIEKADAVATLIRDFLPAGNGLL